MVLSVRPYNRKGLFAVTNIVNFRKTCSLRFWQDAEKRGFSDAYGPQERFFLPENRLFGGRFGRFTVGPPGVARVKRSKVALLGNCFAAEWHIWGMPAGRLLRYGLRLNVLIYRFLLFAFAARRKKSCPLVP